jgi:cellulose synthase/poly-beta-1,6-N-acetylglucosamine synthase-like glycosyltransferase
MSKTLSEQPGICSNGDLLASASPIDAGSTAPIPFVSVVIPMRNEEEYAEKCILSLLHQTYPGDRYEVLVVDGNSSDKSCEIVQRLQPSYPNLRLLHNPAGIVPTSMNLGIRSGRGEIVVRADAHTVYPDIYIERCVRYLNQTNADNVGGPIRTIAAGKSFGAQLVVAVLGNRFGVGNSEFRTSAREGYVDTVPFGTFRKDLFDRVGFFNEQLVRNQDNEMNARIRKAGGKIYLTPALTTDYFAPSTFEQLLRQTYRNARWHFFTLRQMRGALGVRHLLPAGFVLTLGLCGVLAFTTTWARVVLAVILLVHVLIGYTFAARQPNARPVVRLALPFAFLAFHACYGIGTIAGLPFVITRPGTSPIR